MSQGTEAWGGAPATATVESVTGESDPDTPVADLPVADLPVAGGPLADVPDAGDSVAGTPEADELAAGEPDADHPMDTEDFAPGDGTKPADSLRPDIIEGPLVPARPLRR